MVRQFNLKRFQQQLESLLHEASGTPLAAARWVGIQAGGTRWLLPLVDVAEIVPYTHLVKVPFSQPWYRGVAKTRGQLFGVIDFAALNGEPTTHLNHHVNLLLIHPRHGVASALLVGRVLGLRDEKEYTELPWDTPPSALPPWVARQWGHPHYGVYFELDVLKLVQHPRFVHVSCCDNGILKDKES
jgi:twitching motility protein PilI